MARRSRRWLYIGYLADGLFKVALALAYTLAVAPIGRMLGAAEPLILLSAVMLLLSGVAEIAFARRRAAAPQVWLLVGYDSAWLLVTALALILAGQGGSAGGELWFGFQAVGSVVLAIAFAIGSRSRLPN